MNSSSDTNKKKPLPCCREVTWENDGLLEPHKVETEDGYILTVYRVKDKEQDNIDNNKVPVLLIPGLFNGGKEWLAHKDREKTLPKMLLNTGAFSVWLGCNRGTPHSKEHLHLKTKSKKFWDFSFDEMAKFDVPAFIDYILDRTKSKSLGYIGFSMGGAMILATLSSRPEYTSKVNVAVSLAPGVYGYNYKTFNKLVIPMGSKVLPEWKFLYRRELCPKPMTSMVKQFIPGCVPVRRENFAGSLVNLVGRVSGPIIKGDRMEKEMLQCIATLVPASTSIKHLGHICQIFNAKKFQAFDYGRKTNLKKYGTVKPPCYDLKRVKVPVATFTANHDYLVPQEGVSRAAAELSNLIKHYVITAPKFSHCDFLFGKDAHVVVYPEIVKLLMTYGVKNTEDEDNKEEPNNGANEDNKYDCCPQDGQHTS